MSINQWPKKATAEEWAAFKLGRKTQKQVTRVAWRNNDTLAEACREIAARFPTHPAGEIAEKAIDKCKPMAGPTEWR